MGWTKDLTGLPQHEAGQRLAKALLKAPSPCCCWVQVQAVPLGAVSALPVLTPAPCPRRQDPHPHGVQGRAGVLRHEAEVSSEWWQQQLSAQHLQGALPAPHSSR